MYEHKCRDKEEADQNVNRNTNTGNAKQIEKVVVSAAKGQHDELWASLPAAASCLSPRSSKWRPYRRSRTLTKQVPHLPQSQQPSAPWKRANSSEGASDGSVTETFVVWAFLTSGFTAALCFPGRHVLPAERQHAGQSSGGLDKGARQHLWGKDCFGKSKDKEAGRHVERSFPSLQGVWKLCEGAHRLPEERRVDAPQPSVPAVCDRRWGG